MKRYRTEIKWGLIFSVAQLAWIMLERLAGLHDQHIDKHAQFSMLFMFVAFAVYAFALLDKRKRDYGGYMTYQQGLKSGLIIAAVVTVLSPLVQVIISKVITPEYFTNAIEHAVSSEALTRVEAETYFNLNSYIVQVLISTPILGLVTSLVMAFFTRKSPPVTADSSEVETGDR